MHFYRISDEAVMAMPSRRFWFMEKQISRIRAESDLRSINVAQAVNTTDAFESATERLVLDLGETTQVQRAIRVKGDPDRKAKFAKVMR